MREREIREKAAAFMSNRGWRQLTAKRRGYEQSLFEHTMNEVDALLVMLPILRSELSFGLTAKEEKTLIVSVIAHDIGKEKPEWQEYVIGKRGFVSDVDQDLAMQVVPELAELFNCQDLEETISAVLLHMRHERTEAKVFDRLLTKHENPRWKTLADIVDAIDNICSAKGILTALDSLRHSLLGMHLSASYHLVEVRGVSTPFIHRAAMDAFVILGWKPLLHYSDGSIYVTSAGQAIEVPSVDDIRANMAVAFDELFRQTDLESLVVGKNSTASMLPKPDLFDYRDVSSYLRNSARKAGRLSFKKKKEVDRKRVISKYLGEPVGEITDIELERQTDRISSAYPEMVIFKFFKVMSHRDFLGREVQLLVQKLYDNVFGEGAYGKLRSTSTLDAAKDMANTVDFFWRLPGSKFGLAVEKMEDSPDKVREEKLIEALSNIAKRVFESLPNPPKGPSGTYFAEAFIHDLVYPQRQIDFRDLVFAQMEAYLKSKPVAGRSVRGKHLCPICNTPFTAGEMAKSDFLDSPESHTNRAVAHARYERAVICDACKYERILRQILLGGKPAALLVLLPRMNIGHGSGELLVRKALTIRDEALKYMSQDSTNPDQRVTLALTRLIARKAAGRDIFDLSAEELVDLLTYQSSQKKQKDYRKELDRLIKEEIGGESVGDFNTFFGTDFVTWDDAMCALIQNEIVDETARRLRREAFRLMPQMSVICQVPNMVFVPILYGFSVNQESEANVALRKLFIELMIGLALDCSAAIIEDKDVLTLEGGEGVALVPKVSAIRDLIGLEWIPLNEALKWLDAIGAASILAQFAEFPERSNLFQILSAPTPGHILRRIERKRENTVITMRHVDLLEKVKEVLH